MDAQAKLVTFLIATLLFTSCGGVDNKQLENDVINVKVMTIGTTMGSKSYNYTGTVEEESSTILSFATGGTLERIYVNIGDRVRKGQLIAVINSASSQNSYNIAHAARVQAEDAYQRMKQLHERGSLPDIKWVEVESQLSQAVAADEIALKNLNDSKLYALTDGVVSERYVEPGQNIAPASPIVKVANTRELDVKVYVPEGDMSSIEHGQTASIRIPALHNKELSAKVVEKGVIADPLSRSYAVKMRILEDEKDVLPGMIVQLCFDNSVTTNEIIVPSRLLQLADDGDYYLWLSAGGTAVRRKVTVGEFSADGVIITEGLMHGDSIICEGQHKVCNGCKVNVIH